MTDSSSSRPDVPSADAESSPRDTLEARQFTPAIRFRSRDSVDRLPGLGSFLFGAVIPSAALAVELLTGIMREIYADPIPTPWHAILLGMLVVVPVFVRRALVASMRCHRLPSRYAYFANAFCATVAALYAIAYIPVLPIAVVCTLCFGLGLMGFAPILNFALSMKHRYWLTKLAQHRGSPRGVVTCAGVLAGITVLTAVSWSPCVTPWLVHRGLSVDIEKRDSAVRWLRRFASERRLRAACYEGIRHTGGLSLFGLDGGPRHLDEIRALYYRVHGRAFDELPRPSVDWWRYRLSPALRRRGERDRGLGGERVDGKVSGVSLVSSDLEIRLSDVDEASGVDPLLAYMEWTMTFANAARVEREARCTIAMPPDAVASRLTLWIQGEEREAAFGSRKRVRNAYRDVAVVRRRDPALLTTDGRHRVMLQCFPILPGGQMRVKVGITAPLVVRDGRAYLRFPHLAEANFEEKTEHRVRPLHAAPYWIGRRRDVVTTAVSTHSLTTQRMRDPTEGWLAVRPSGVGTVAGTLGIKRASMTLHPIVDPDANSSSFVVVVDGSSAFARARFDLAELVLALPPEAKIHVIHAGDDCTSWHDGFRPKDASLLRWLESRTYEGGPDPTLALSRAWSLARRRAGCHLLWVHGPMPIEYRLRSDWIGRLTEKPYAIDGRRLRIRAISATAGVNRVADALEEEGTLERVSILGSFAESLRYVLRRGRTRDVRREYRFVESRSDPPPTESRGLTSHLVRLAVADQVFDAIRHESPSLRARATELAASFRIVTPWTGAVVLERSEQYERHELDPDENSDAVPSVPEPEEWAMLLVGFLLLAWVHRTRRRREGARGVLAA